VSRAILVVDDSATTRSLVAAYLSEWADFEVVEAASGFEALKVLPARPVDLIMTDINMPDINGLELISFVRANPLYRGIPVIIITTENSAEDRKRGLELGASEYLVKPFTLEQLRRAVSAVLGRGPAGGAP
jgi:two-component system chemotaxis response regulator CheY